MRLFPILVIGISLLLLQGCAKPKPDKVLVTVNGTPIREKQVLAEIDKRIDEEAARAADGGLVYDESERNVTRAFMRDGVLHTLVERRLIADQLTLDDIKITEAEVDARFLEKVLARGQTLAEAETEIKAQRKTLPDVKERIRWHTLGVEKLYERHARNKRKVTEADALQIYTESPAEYRQEHERRVSRILISAPPDTPEVVKNAARAQAEELLRRIKAGEDFAALARTHSDDPLTKARGGDRGWSTRGFVTAPGNDPFGDVAFAMKNIGDMSDVVETPDGYEIIKLTGMKDARQKSFDEVKAQIIERVRYWEIGNFWEEFATQMRSNAKIEWDPAEKTRRDKREKDEREYSAEVAKQLAREQKEAQEAPPSAALATEAPRSGSPNGKQ